MALVVQKELSSICFLSVNTSFKAAVDFDEFHANQWQSIVGCYFHRKLNGVDSAINRLQHPTDPVQTPSDSPVGITWPFKDQKSADVVFRQLGDLGTKINQ